MKADIYDILLRDAKEEFLEAMEAVFRFIEGTFDIIEDIPVVDVFSQLADEAIDDVEDLNCAEDRRQAVVSPCSFARVWQNCAKLYKTNRAIYRPYAG